MQIDVESILVFTYKTGQQHLPLSKVGDIADGGRICHKGSDAGLRQAARFHQVHDSIMACPLLSGICRMKCGARIVSIGVPLPSRSSPTTSPATNTIVG
jgi:hypothetical protein